MLGNQCNDCLVGRCRPTMLPYLRLFGTHMIVLPNAPASKCDMCGKVDYQPEFLLTMQVMLEEIAKEQRSGGLTKGGRSQRDLQNGRLPVVGAK
jgi:hypothetical protein